MKKTMTEVQAEISLVERNKLVIETLKEMQKLLIKLNDCIEILLHPLWEIK